MQKKREKAFVAAVETISRTKQKTASALNIPISSKLAFQNVLQSLATLLNANSCGAVCLNHDGSSALQGLDPKDEYVNKLLRSGLVSQCFIMSEPLAFHGFLQTTLQQQLSHAVSKGEVNLHHIPPPPPSSSSSSSSPSPTLSVPHNHIMRNSAPSAFHAGIPPKLSRIFGSGNNIKEAAAASSPSHHMQQLQNQQHQQNMAQSPMASKNSQPAQSRGLIRGPMSNLLQASQPPSKSKSPEPNKKGGPGHQQGAVHTAKSMLEEAKVSVICYPIRFQQHAKRKHALQSKDESFDSRASAGEVEEEIEKDPDGFEVAISDGEDSDVDEEDSDSEDEPQQPQRGVRFSEESASSASSSRQGKKKAKLGEEDGVIIAGEHRGSKSVDVAGVVFFIRKEFEPNFSFEDVERCESVCVPVVENMAHELLYPSVLQDLESSMPGSSTTASALLGFDFSSYVMPSIHQLNAAASSSSSSVAASALATPLLPPTGSQQGSKPSSSSGSIDPALQAIMLKYNGGSCARCDKLSEYVKTMRAAFVKELVMLKEQTKSVIQGRMNDANASDIPELFDWSNLSEEEMLEQMIKDPRNNKAPGDILPVSIPGLHRHDSFDHQNCDSLVELRAHIDKLHKSRKEDHSKVADIIVHNQNEVKSLQSHVVTLREESKQMQFNFFMKADEMKQKIQRLEADADTKAAAEPVVVPKKLVKEVSFIKHHAAEPQGPVLARGMSMKSLQRKPSIRVGGTFKSPTLLEVPSPTPPPPSQSPAPALSRSYSVVKMDASTMLTKGNGDDKQQQQRGHRKFTADEEQLLPKDQQSLANTFLSEALSNTGTKVNAEVMQDLTEALILLDAREAKELGMDANEIAELQHRIKSFIVMRKKGISNGLPAAPQQFKKFPGLSKGSAPAGPASAFLFAATGGNGIGGQGSKKALTNVSAFEDMEKRYRAFLERVISKRNKIRDEERAVMEMVLGALGFIDQSAQPTPAAVNGSAVASGGSEISMRIVSNSGASVAAGSSSPIPAYDSRSLGGLLQQALGKPTRFDGFGMQDQQKTIVHVPSSSTAASVVEGARRMASTLPPVSKALPLGVKVGFGAKLGGGM